ncbi:MAG: glucan biosynthesis protein G [Rhodobacteraceae bacterium]|nr:glucan biosynthesis protein G [Paracoccaceae bacterium]MAY45426.1 glucan biosynthesis protein G [Paracoccaceae bacterium]
MTINRRDFFASTVLAVLASGAAFASGSDVPFDRSVVIQRARDLAGSKFHLRDSAPADWLDMSYEQYLTMWARHDRALWHGTDRSYEVDFFLPGPYFPRPVRINTVENGMAQPVAFDFSRFDRTDKAPDLPVEDGLGYSGLRLRTELDGFGHKNEFCVFQGASYFRAIGVGEIYGLSARGLALNTADPEGEEFPEFIEFWLEAPGPDQREIVLHALMDSPSVTGAYRFLITPGSECVMEVEATLFPRVDIDHVGLGPLTSMFLFDGKDRTRFHDFRPAVHDSDGLLIRNGVGEVIWRPLNNPRELQISSFVDENPQGFGLLQRPRKFSDYNDLEALYHKRPGLWVQPKGNWGKGAVTLVEIPADREIYDNIVAYWRPAEVMKAGEQVDLAYRLTWGQEEPLANGLPRVLNTAMGDGWHEGQLVAIDFEANPLFDDGLDKIGVQLSSPHVETTEGVLQRNPETGGPRLAFGFDPKDLKMVEIRAQLLKDGAPASEAWLYRWTA